jgi:hypothetical protein
MAEKTVRDIEKYQVNGPTTINLDVKIGYAQKSVNTVYLNGALVGQSIGSFNQNLDVKPGDSIYVYSTVSDINQAVDNTSVDIKITGGMKELQDPHSEVADKDDLVFYDLSYYVV